MNSRIYDDFNAWKINTEDFNAVDTPTVFDQGSSDRDLYERFGKKAAIGAVYALILVSFIGLLGWLTDPEPSCTLIDPADVDAGLDYADNTWTYQDGTRFGFAPEEDSFITPWNCYTERNQ